MTHSHLLRRLSCLLLTVFLLSIPASAFVIGTAEDLEHLRSMPENSDPLPAQNSKPIATNLEFSTYKNVAICETLSAFDPDGDLLTFRITKNPARGSVCMAEDGSSTFTYTPYENKRGKDSFTYVVEDTSGNVSTPATVKLRIQKARTKICYADMSTHPAHKAAVRLAEMNVLVGQRMGDAYFFQPEQTLSREEFLSMSMQALDTKLLKDVVSTGFSDDAAIETWAKPYVATALHGGMISGATNEMGEAVFQPDRPMTCGEASVLLNRLLQLSNVSNPSEELPSWVSQSVANLEAIGVLQEGDILSVPLTKAEGAMMLSATLDVLDSRTHPLNPFF